MMPSVGSLVSRLRILLRQRKLLLQMAVNQFTGRYAGSALGWSWALLNPLITAASINFVFTRVFSVQTEHYMLLVISGIVPWFFFSNSVFEGISSFAVNAGLLKQSSCPREFIPLSAVVTAFINFLLGLSVVIPLFIWQNPAGAALLPLLIVPLCSFFLFTAGITLMFSTANVFYRDISHFLPVGFMILFWVSPVFYSIDMLPADLRWVYFVNPVSYFLAAFRQVLYESRIYPAFQLYVLAAGVSVFLLGMLVFRREEVALLKRV